MDEKQGIPVWIFDFLFCDVFPDVVEYISGVCRSVRFEADGDAALDI